ncbi:MAG TPA: hypothetical protein VF772_16320 [Terriglobales bacterium]
MHRVYDSAGPPRTRESVRDHIAFWHSHTMGIPHRLISELNA